MKPYDHLQIHQDHRQWDSDIQMWSHDLKIWKEECEALNDAVAFINSAVQSHEEAIANHVESTALHRTRLTKHEQEIKYVREGSLLANELLDLHRDEMAEHSAQRKAHERLKRHHHTVMALTKGLKRALESVHLD